MPLSAQQLNAAAQYLSASAEQQVGGSTSQAPLNTEDQAGLVSQILAQSPNQTIASALLVGSSGESNQNPLSASPGALNSAGQYTGQGGYGAFGFTSSEYTSPGGTHYVPPGAPPSEQVAAILPNYIAAASQVPSNLTGAAQAEWIAIAAEAPLNDTSELATIQSTGGTTEYGANSSFNAQGAYLQAQQEESLGGLPGGGTDTNVGSTGSSSSTGSGPGAPASTSSLYKALQSLNGSMNAATTSSAGSTSFLSELSKVLLEPGVGLIALLSGNLSSTAAPSLGGAISQFLWRAAFTVPGIIVMLGAVAIGVLGVGASGPAKNVLEVVDLAKYATGKGGKSPVPKS